MTSSENKRLYLGHTLPEVMNAGADVLARSLLRDGPPTFENVQGILPSVEKGRYLFLSGPASWRGLIVTPDGWVYPQETAACPSPPPIFSPLEEEPEADHACKDQFLLEDWIPVVTTRYLIEAKQTDITCFVEFGDPDSAPQLWVDVSPGGGDRRCYVISQSRPIVKRAIHPAEYDEAKETTVAQWRQLAQGYDRFALPYPEIKTGLLAMTTSLLATFSGDHAHYGHRYYGREIHDNFPPNYLYAIELTMTLGMPERSWGMLTHLLRFGVDIKGRFCYRQGLKDWYGASGSEYGRLFWLAARLHKSDPSGSPLGAHADTLAQMGEYLTQQIRLDERSGRELIMMCAEADTRSRIHAYTSNNLWAVVGLRALSGLLDDLGHHASKAFAVRAETLWQNIRAALDGETLQSEFGPLVPFRLGYTPLPRTLSFCRDLFSTDDAQREDYFAQLDFDTRVDFKQDYSENTYANYRYYAEMLSSGLLRPEEADAINTMREALGGELLGMTRLYERLDDWPADNYARYYLETDRLDKYLLLYYAHLLYHGNLETGVYYEQVTADGAMFAPDCVPSMALGPLMTAWMFCFQPVDGQAVYLLRGVPSDWLYRETPLVARDMTCAAGRFSVVVTPGTRELRVDIDISFSQGPCTVYIDLPAPAVQSISATGAVLEATSRPGRFSVRMEGASAVLVVDKTLS